LATDLSYCERAFGIPKRSEAAIMKNLLYSGFKIILSTIILSKLSSRFRFHFYFSVLVPSPWRFYFVIL